MQGSPGYHVGREAILRVDEGGAVYLRPFIRGGGGGDGGGSETQGTTSSTTADPNLARLNALKASQIEQGVNLTGGYPAYLSTNPFALPTSRESEIVGQIGQTAGTQGGLAPLETEGLETLRAGGDPSQALELAQSQFEKYAAPIIRNDATVRGQGRAGVVPETLSTGFAQLALPIMQAAQQGRQRFGQEQLRLGGELPGRAIGALETQLRAERSPREQYSAEYMRPLQSLANLIGGLPSGGGTTSSTGYQTGQVDNRSRDVNWVTDVGVPLAVAGLRAYGG